MSYRQLKLEQTGEPADSWDLLTHGALSRDEQALLRALAEENDGDGLRLEAHTPLGGAFRERMVETMGAKLDSAARRRRVRARGFGAAAAVLAAAACMVLWVRPVAVEIPAYALSIKGQVATRRGAPVMHEPVYLTPNSMLDIRLTPALRVRDGVTLSAFLAQGGHARPWPVPVERADSGAFRIQGVASELLKADFGTWDAIFVIAPGAVHALPAANTDGMAVVRTRFHYRPVTPTDGP